MNPDNVVRPQLLNQTLGKDFVYALVLLPPVAFISGERRTIVEQRPEGLVAEPVIKTGHTFFGQENRRHLKMLLAVTPDCFLVFGCNSRSRPAEPQIIGRGAVIPLASREVTCKSGCDSSRAGTEDRAVLPHRRGKRQTVRHDNQAHGSILARLWEK